MTSLLVQCLRIHLAMQRTLVLDWEDPWSGNIPHVLKQQSPCATTTEVVLWSWRAATTEPECTLEPTPSNKKSHHSEKPALCN